MVLLNNIFTYDTDFLLQGFIGSLIITLAEAISGYEWNTVQHLNIWDYSTLPLSFVAGNVSLIFTMGSAAYGDTPVPLQARIEINKDDSIYLNLGYSEGISLILGEFNMDNMTKV